MAGEIYIFAGGGTGGHLYPGLAVAEELLASRPEAKIVFACSSRPIDRHVLDPEPYPIVPQPARPMPRGGRGWPGFLWCWVRSVALAGDLIRDLKPKAVLGLGGFAGAAVVRRAARRGVPTGLLNPDAVPGKANRFLARHAEVIFTQFERSLDSFPPGERGRIRCVGCPVRRAITSAGREEALAHFSLRPDRRTLLVNGGSLGAESINRALTALLDELTRFAETWQVLHITGPAKTADVGSSGGPPIHVRTVEYCRRMDLAYAAADLALGRAGAGTVAEVAATGTPAILMPYPYHKDNHQRLNAEALAAAGAAIVCDDLREVSANVSQLGGVLVGLLEAPGRLDAMRHSARALARPGAAAAVAEWLGQLSGGGA